MAGGVPPAPLALLVVLLLAPLAAGQTPTGPPPPQMCELAVRVEVPGQELLEFSTGTQDECESTPDGGAILDGDWLVWNVPAKKGYTVTDVNERCIQIHVPDRKHARLGGGTLAHGAQDGAAIEILHLDSLRWERVVAPAGTNLHPAWGGGIAFVANPDGTEDTSRIWAYDAPLQAWLLQDAPFLPDIPGRVNFSASVSTPRFPLVSSYDFETGERRILVMDAQQETAHGPFVVGPLDGGWGQPLTIRPHEDRLFVSAKNLTRDEYGHWSLPLPRLDEGEPIFVRPSWDLANLFVAEEGERLPTLPPCSGDLWTKTLTVGAVVAALLAVTTVGLTRRDRQ